MKYILLALLAVAAWWAHAQYVFSEPRAMRFVGEHMNRAMSGDAAACDDLADDATIDLVAEEPQGVSEIEGGKAEICEYYKDAAAALRLLQAQTNSRFEGVQVKSAGFPWMSADVSYTEYTSIALRMMGQSVGNMRSVSEDTVTLRRGLGGVKITAIKSNSTTSVERP